MTDVKETMKAYTFYKQAIQLTGTGSNVWEAGK